VSILSVKNLVKTYKRRKTREILTAVDNISMNIDKGEIFALLGPNGAGKTTTIKAICGLLLPDSGVITVKGEDVVKHRSTALHHINAVLEGNRNLYYRLTPVENIIYFCGIRGEKITRKDAIALLEVFGITDRSDDLVQQLSRGMQQKAAIATTLATKAEVLLLDEPTLGLDVSSAIELRRLMKEIVSDHGRTILLSTHDMNLVEAVADRVAIMNKGRIVVCEKKEKLMKLFTARAYRIRLTQVSEGIMSLFASLEPRDIQKENGFVDFTVDLTNQEVLFELVERVRQSEARIESIEQEQVNFERIFLKYISDQ